MVPYTALEVATLSGKSVREVLEAARRNTKRMYGI
jgi:hypothetical protein